MKLLKINKSFELLLLIFLMISSSVYAFDGKHKYEKLWKESGPKTILKQKAYELNLNEMEMNAFVFHYKQEFDSRSHLFWKNVLTDTGWANYNELETKLKVDVQYYTELLNKFNFSKIKGEKVYNEAIKNWQTATAPAPTPPPIAICDNVDFENTTSPFSGWTAWEGIACYYTPSLSCMNFSTALTYPAGFGPLPSYVPCPPPPTPCPTPPFEILSTSSGNDRFTGISRVKGNYSLRMSDDDIGGFATQASYTFTVDGSKPVYRYNYALVLEEPSGVHHDLEEKPFFLVTFWQGSTELTCYREMIIADANDKKFSDNTMFNEIAPGSLTKFTNWLSKTIDLTDQIGQTITVRFVVSDCALGGHLGYAYIDGDCFQDHIAVGSCLVDGSVIVSTDNLFTDYQWEGDGIVGDNDKYQIKVNKTGKYTVYRNASLPCFTSESVLVTTCPPPSPTACSLTVTKTTGSCDVNTNLFYVDLQISLTGGPSKGFIKITCDMIEHFIKLPITNPTAFKFSNLLADGNTTRKIVVSVYADNYISFPRALCTQTITIDDTPIGCGWGPILSCADCIGGFMPVQGETYAISAWVKQKGLNNVITYTDPFIQIQYSGGASNPPQFKADGNIIEGWQRIYKEFTIPSTGAGNITVQLGTGPGGDGIASFDDIRIYPLKASMKSYVYDPISLKLVAVLDENNFATFYEYDQEGALIRTKKETERGIVTISENRQSNPKK